MLVALDINCLIRDLVKTTVQARDPLLGGWSSKRPGISSQGRSGYVRDQGSQANGGGGHVRDQGFQGKGGERVCGRPGVSGQWWGWVCKRPGVSGQGGG